MSPSEPLTPAPDGPARRARFEAFREVALALQRAAESARNYAPEHPSVSQALDRLQERLSATLEAFGALEFELTTAGIVFDGEPVTPRAGVRDFLTRRLFAEGIRRVAILQGAPVDEVRTLLELWTKSRGPGQPADESLSSRLWEADFKFIRLVILDTLNLDDQEGEGGERAGADSDWRSTFHDDVELLVSLMQLESPPVAVMEGGGVTATTETLPLLESEGIRDITPDDLARQDVEGQRLEEVDPEVLASMSSALTAELPQPEARFLRALLNGALALPSARPGFVAASTRAASRLAAEGRFEQAIEAFQRTLEAVRASPRHDPARVDVLAELRQSITADEVLARLVGALDDELTAERAERCLRKLGSAFAPKLRELGAALKTEAGQARLDALVRTTGAAPPDRAAAPDGPLTNVSGLAAAEAAALLARALTQPDAQQRRAAAQSLDANNALLVPRARLHSRIGDTDAVVRRLVIRVLGLIEDVSAVPLLKARLSRPLPAEERLVIYAALADMHAPQAQELLVEGALNEDDVTVRVACIEQLATYPSPRVVRVLEGLAGKLLVHWKVRSAATEALEKLDTGRTR
ncbi:MAG: HEAT repeat domain-containing protein [Myxococcaceae bacterium]|nr:HEAT repeat domain-containing protein [Myxococcaceae bacterium]MCA3013567.1 HEAT repeat domain-containing protein [Myxococcaceae bacterium]